MLAAMYTIESIVGRKDKQRDVIVFFLAFGLQDQFLDQTTSADKGIQWSVNGDKFQEVLDKYQNQFVDAPKSMMIKPYPPIVKKVCDCAGTPAWTSGYFPEEHGSVVCFLLKNKSDEYWIVRYGNTYAFYTGGPHIIQHFRNIDLIAKSIKKDEKNVLDPSSWGASVDTLRNKNHPKEKDFPTSLLHKWSILNQIIPRSDPPQHDDIKCPDCGGFSTTGFRLDETTFQMTLKKSEKGPGQELKKLVQEYKSKLGDNVAFITRIQDQPRTCCVAFWRRLRTHVLHRHGSLIYTLLLVKGKIEPLAKLPWAVIREWATYHAAPDKLLRVNWSPARDKKWDGREDPTSQSPFHAHRIWLGLLPLPMPSDKAKEFPAASLLEYMLSRADLITHHIDTMLSDPEEVKNITKVFPYLYLSGGDYTFIENLDPKAFSVVRSAGTGQDIRESKNELEIYGSSTELWNEYMVTVFPLIRAIFSACGYRLINPCQLPDEVIAGHRWEMYPVFGHEPRFAIEPIRSVSKEWWAYTGFRLFKDNALLLQLLVRIAVFCSEWESSPPLFAIARIFKDAQIFASKYLGVDEAKNNPLLKFGRRLKDYTFPLKYVKIQPFSDEGLKVVALADTSLKDAPPGLFDDGFGFLETMRRGILLSPNDTDVSPVLSSEKITEFDVIAPGKDASFLFNKKDSINLALFIPPKHFYIWLEDTVKDPELDADWHRRLANGMCRAGHIDLFRLLRFTDKKNAFFALQGTAQELIRKHDQAIEAGALQTREKLFDRYNMTTTIRGIDPMRMYDEVEHVLSWGERGVSLSSFMPFFRRASALLRDIQQANVNLFSLEESLLILVSGAWCPSFENPMPLSPLMASEVRKNSEFMSLLWQNLAALIHIAYGKGAEHTDKRDKVVLKLPAPDKDWTLFQRRMISSMLIFPSDQISIETIGNATPSKWIRDRWNELVTKSPPEYRIPSSISKRLKLEVDHIEILTTQIAMTEELKKKVADILYFMEYAFWARGRITRVVWVKKPGTDSTRFANISLTLDGEIFKFQVNAMATIYVFHSELGKSIDTTIMNIVNYLSEKLDERDVAAPSNPS
jgi:hypothetical protein